MARRLIVAASTVGGWVLVAGGGLLARVQRLVGAQADGRGLTGSERERLLVVFGGSVAFDEVRVIEGRSGLFGLNDRPFTLGNAIYLKDVDPATRFDILVHECVHVWQHQHLGPRYAVEALAAQLRYGWRGRGAYDWRAELARGHHRWTDFNREAQGSFIQELWTTGALQRGPTASFLLGGSDQAALATDALDALRGPPRGQRRHG